MLHTLRFSLWVLPDAGPRIIEVSRRRAPRTSIINPNSDDQRISYFSGVNTSTDSVTVRASVGDIAPTPMTFRAISSPRSLRIETTTEYCQDAAASGFRNEPSTMSAEKVGCAPGSTIAFGSKRRWWWQPGQMPARSRIVALQCGQILVFPGGGTLLFIGVFPGYSVSALRFFMRPQFRATAHTRAGCYLQ